MAIILSKDAFIYISNTHTEAPSVSDSQVRACHYHDYLDGNPNRGHITGMTETPFAAKLQASIMAHRIQQAIS